MTNEVKKYKVRADEEELGSIYYNIITDDNVENVMKNLDMASKYAVMSTWFFDPEDPENEEIVKKIIDDYGYDNHYIEMFKVKKSGNGLDAFEYYLKEICKYTVKQIHLDDVDFVFEW